ncbi:MAG: hypothetical protein QXI16_00745 [Sulfolobaceae archaeon]
MSKNVTSNLLKWQQIRIGIENMAVPILLIIFNAVLAFIAILGNNYLYVIVFAIFAGFSLLIQLLVIYYSKYWKGRV